MKLGLLTAVIVFMATSAMSQHAHRSSSVTETGQSQFAAMAEIVALLRDNPDTDWAQIDVGALRDHLVDMDNVTTKAISHQTVSELSVTFNVTGDATTAVSIQRMVLSHSPMLQQATGWSVEAEERADGATMTIQVASKDEMNQVKGLGYFGLMTVGAHHQQHHLMIAMGRSPH